MNLNVDTWVEFNLSRTNEQPGLFKIENCKCSCADDLEDGTDINYIGAKKNDNGVMRRVKIVPELVTKGNGILFICDGQGSVGYTNYMKDDFIGSTTTAIGYDSELNEIRAMFLVSVLDKERFKYSFGRKYKRNLPKVKISLPMQRNEDGTPKIDNTCKYSSDGYTPDWEFMENFIKTLHYKPITTRNKKDASLKLDVSDWKEFNLTDLFGHARRGTRIATYDRVDGNIPFITAGEQNHGVSALISNKEAVTHNNAITIDMFGNAFYHDYDFKCDDNILVMSNEYIDVYTGNFIASILMQDKYRCSYGRQYRQADYNSHKILLPIKYDDSGSPMIDKTHRYSPDGYIPDWQMMSDYIKSLPFGDKLAQAVGGGIDVI